MKLGIIQKVMLSAFFGQVYFVVLCNVFHEEVTMNGFTAAGLVSIGIGLFLMFASALVEDLKNGKDI